MQPAAREVSFIYTTLPNTEAASAFGKALVERKLAACVNIFPSMTSIYEWQGSIQVNNETAMIIKTSRAVLDEALAVAKDLHPYETPALLTLPVTGGNDDYLSWVAAQTGQN